MLAAAGPPTATNTVMPPSPGSMVLSSWTAREIPSPGISPANSPGAGVPESLSLSSSGDAAKRGAAAAELGNAKPSTKAKRASFGRNLHKMSNILTPLHGADATSDADKAGATKRRRSLPSTARFEIDRGSAPLAVAFDLGTLEWKQHRSSKGKAGTQPVPKGCTLAAALAELIQQKHSTEAADAAAKWGEQLLASATTGHADSIHPGTELSDVEKSVTAALEILQSMKLVGGVAAAARSQQHDSDAGSEWEWATCLPQGQQWCVGGSVLATYKARNEDGCAQSLVLVTCRSAAGSGTDGEEEGVPGNVAMRNPRTRTCERHCVVRLDDVLVDGQWWQTLQLKKCTWAQCCERSAPYASPPEIPWAVASDLGSGTCHTCVQQQELTKAEDKKTAVQAQGTALNATAVAQSEAEAEAKASARAAGSAAASSSSAAAATAAARGSAKQQMAGFSFERTTRDAAPVRPAMPPNPNKRK